MNYRFCVEFEHPNFSTKCVCRKHIKNKDQVYEEIQSYLKKHPEASFMRCYKGYWDSEKEDYIIPPACY